MIRALVVFAHPDDETLFFGGTIASRPEVCWELVCVTDGGPRARERAAELQRAATALGASKLYQLEFADDPNQRLNATRLEEALKSLGEFDEVYTHGALGDYGHPHHQDVCLAVHRAFEGHEALWSVATGVLPERVTSLSAQAYATKSHIMRDVYEEEHRRFMLALPVTSSEGFVRLSLAELESLHAYLSGQTELKEEAVRVHRDLLPMVKAGAVESSARAFFRAYAELVS